MLGPMVNIYRVPQDGRSFESAGEDPLLAGEAGAAIIRGVQSTGVIATVKHFVANNQEFNRTTTSAQVDERTLYEIYYPAFAKAIEAGVGSVMCGYNLVNGVYDCENNATLNTALKERMGFKGFVMSDWGATHSTALAANSGLDMEMPHDDFFGPALKQAVSDGSVSLQRIDDMVYRILVPMFALGIFDRPPRGDLGVDARSPRHTQVAFDTAVAGTVLLKNEGVGTSASGHHRHKDQSSTTTLNSAPVLPLADTEQTIAVIGDGGSVNVYATGGGSGHVIPPYIRTPLEGITDRATRSKVIYAPTNPIGGALAAAAEADVVVFVVGVDSSEGRDRANLSLASGQDELISKVAPKAKKSVVVINSPGAVLMPWIDSVESVVWAGYPGQVIGDAIAAILFGDVNPSGKLPVTFPASEQEVPTSTLQQYPGINNVAEYSEKLFVGYRWFDKVGKTPLFPFGHGLSYTTFKLTSFEYDAAACSFSFSVANTGTVSGAEVVQVYVEYPASASEPVRQLRGFQKVFLKPGQSASGTITLDERALSVWDVASHRFVPVFGQFEASLGVSSRDLRLHTTFTISS